MKKYTIKEFAEGKKAVKIENEEQWNKLNSKFNLCSFSPNFIYYSNDNGWCNKSWFETNGWEVLEFSQLDFEDEFVKGSWYKHNNWYLKFEQIHCGLFQAYEAINDQGLFYKYQRLTNFGVVKDGVYNLCEDLSEIQQYLPENHPDLIKKDTKESTMEKEILGYKLKEEFLHCKEYAAHIGEYNNRYDTQEYLLKESDRTLKCGIIRLKEAGVLDLWFEPVYKEEFKVGDWVELRGGGNGMMPGKRIICQLLEIDEKQSPSGHLQNESHFMFKQGREFYTTNKSHIVRLANPEEIKAAQIQLPTIKGKQCVDNGDKTITCGCTTKSFDWIFGVYYAMGDDIYISDTKVTHKEIKQIVEYINNNK